MTHLPAPSPSGTDTVEAVEIGSNVGGPATECATPRPCATVSEEQAPMATQPQQHRCKASCGFHGSSNTGGYCSRCWRHKLATEFEARKAAAAEASAAAAASKPSNNAFSGRRIMRMGSRVKEKKKQPGDGGGGGSRSILESWVTKATTTAGSGYKSLAVAAISDDAPLGKELTPSSSSDEEEGKFDDEEERRRLEPPPADEKGGNGELLETWANSTVSYESETTVLYYAARNTPGGKPDHNDNKSDEGGSPGRRRQPSQLQVEAMQFASSSIEVIKRNPRKTATLLCSGIVGGVAGGLIAGPAGAVIGAKVCQVSTGAMVAVDSYAPVVVGGGGSSAHSSPTKGGVRGMESASTKREGR